MLMYEQNVSCALQVAKHVQNAPTQTHFEEKLQKEILFKFGGRYYGCFYIDGKPKCCNMEQLTLIIYQGNNLQVRQTLKPFSFCVSLVINPLYFVFVFLVSL